MASITSVSAPGGGNHVHIGDVMVPIRDDATSQGINSLQRRMDLIKKKYKTPIQARANLINVGSAALAMTPLLQENPITHQVLTQMQNMFSSDAVVNVGTYVNMIAENGDISLAAIKHRTGELINSLKNWGSQAKSTLYDASWKSKATSIDFINSQLGHQTIEQTILANEAIVKSVVRKYIRENSVEGEADMPYPQALEEILNLGMDDPIYVELVSAQQRAAELFYFSVWGRSAVTDMNIELRGVVETFNGDGFPILPRTNATEVEVDALSTARDYAADMVRPDPEDEVASEKWIKFMLYLGLSEDPKEGVNGAKYYGIPATIEELERNLRTDFVTAVTADLEGLEQQWKYYKSVITSGDSIGGYYTRINDIMIRIQEGVPEINNVIQYVRGNMAQIRSIYPGVKWGYAQAFADAAKDYDAAMGASKEASTQQGVYAELYAKAKTMHDDIRQELNKRNDGKHVTAEAEGTAHVPPSQEKAASVRPLETLEPGSAGRFISSGANLMSPVGRNPGGDDKSNEEEEMTQPEKKRVRMKPLSEGQQPPVRTRVTKRSVETAPREGDDDIGFGGARTKKRRPKRAAKKTRKGKRGKAGRMSRKTRKTTRGRKAKKAKKTRKTRRHKRK